jgi:hypothetical protein
MGKIVLVFERICLYEKEKEREKCRKREREIDRERNGDDSV